MRYSNEQKQEKISRNQFNQFLDQFEWITSDVYPDLGEDILVRIYDDGFSTGISFYVQLKSADEISSYKLKSKIISYKLYVKDLIHWEFQGVPVLFVIWDVNKERGWWRWVSEIVKDNDSRKPDWRIQTTINVHLHIENELDELSLRRIRFQLADYYLPNIAKDKPIDIKTKFQFPNTPEGKRKAKELEESFESGDRIEVESEYISEIKFPDWFERLYGGIGKDHQKFIIGPVHDTTPKAAKIELSSPKHGVEIIPYVDFRIEKSGNSKITLSNVDQKIPYKIELVMKKLLNRVSFTIRASYSNLDANDAQNVLSARRILADGGNLTITFLSTNEKISNPIPKGMVEEPDEIEVEFLKNIREIQEHFSQDVMFPDDGSFSVRDILEARRLTSIIEEGSAMYEGGEFKVDLTRQGVVDLFSNLDNLDTASFRMEWDPYSIGLLSSNIDTGPMTQRISGKWTLSKEEILSWLDEADETDNLIVVLEDVRVSEIYHDWIQETP